MSHGAWATGMLAAAVGLVAAGCSSSTLSSPCSATPTTSLQIYPPDQTTAISLAYTSTGCASTKVNLLTIGVVQPGAGSGG